MVVSLILVALLAGLFGLSSTLNPIDAILGRAAIVEVPDLVGRTQPAALAEARAAGFDPKVISVFSLTGKRGSVVAQDPKPESRARQGSVLEIAVSRGANRVEVADVVGKSLAEVRPPFDDAGIRIEVTEETSETAAKGIIIRQDPGPGVVVTGKDTVRFVVSKGADPRPVPQVAGLQPVGAGYELGKAGLTVGTSAAVNDPSVVVGAVVSTDPPAGTPVEKDRAINLAVSAGPAPVPVPEVRNQPVEAAVAAVRQAGLVPNLVSSAGGSHVINQDPAPAAPLTPGLAVTLTLGPPSATTTTTTVPPTTVPPTTVPPAPVAPGGPGG